MKKTIWLCMLCLVLLAPVLSACGNPASTRAAVPTATPEPSATPVPAPEPTATPVPAPEETSETSVPPEPERYTAYQELVKKVTQGLQSGWADTTPEELGISDVFKRSGELRLGWVQTDINGDGADELLFGEITEDGEGSPVYVIFTLLGEELLHPATGWEFNRWYLVEGGKLINEVSSTGYDVYRSAYGFFNGALVPAKVWVDRSEYLHLSLESFDAIAS